MKFFLDTANLDEIREGVSLGVVDGVTTNPSLMAKEGIKGDAAIRQHYVAICGIVPGDVSAEVISTDLEGMLREADLLSGLHPQIVVKIPCTKAGIQAIATLRERKTGIRTNCTLIFSLGQALLAAKAGATYVSPFIGRLDDIGSDGVELVGTIVRAFEHYGYPTSVLAASIRHPQHILRCIEVGAHVATCPLSAILPLLNHPLTDIGLEKFLADYHRVNG